MDSTKSDRARILRINKEIVTSSVRKRFEVFVYNSVREIVDGFVCVLKLISMDNE